MNKKLYTRLYKDNPGDFSNPIYVGGYYEKVEGMPAKRFRLVGVAISAGITLLLLMIGSMLSVPGKALYATLPYVLTYLPAVMSLFAFLHAPSDDGRMREDTWHNSMERIQMYSVFGILFSAVSLIGGVVACILAKTLGVPELLFLLMSALNTGGFVVIRRMRKRQIYKLFT